MNEINTTYVKIGKEVVELHKLNNKNCKTLNKLIHKIGVIHNNTKKIQEQITSNPLEQDIPDSIYKEIGDNLSLNRLYKRPLTNRRKYNNLNDNKININFPNE